MKLTDRFFDDAGRIADAAAVDRVLHKYREHSAADLFDLNDSDASLSQFVLHWQAQGLANKSILDRTIACILNDDLHPLQAARISRILDDPSDDLEPEDKEVLIDQVLNLEWPTQIIGDGA